MSCYIELYYIISYYMSPQRSTPARRGTEAPPACARARTRCRGFAAMRQFFYVECRGHTSLCYVILYHAILYYLLYYSILHYIPLWQRGPPVGFSAGLSRFARSAQGDPQSPSPPNKNRKQ